MSCLEDLSFGKKGVDVLSCLSSKTVLINLCLSQLGQKRVADKPCGGSRRQIGRYFVFSHLWGVASTIGRGRVLFCRVGSPNRRIKGPRWRQTPRRGGSHIIGGFPDPHLVTGGENDRCDREIETPIPRSTDLRLPRNDRHEYDNQP